MGFTLRFWGECDQRFPGYEASDQGEVRKIGDDYKYLLPQFWGKTDQGEPQWMITLCDDEGKDFVVPVSEVIDSASPSWIGKYEY